MRYLIIVLLIIYSFSIYGQKTNKREANQDTTLTKLLENIPKEEHKEFKKKYRKLTPQAKELIAYMAELPMSSKKELIANIDTNYQNVVALKLLFNKLVPTDFNIYIEFKPPEKILHLGESIDLWVWKTDSSGLSMFTIQQWDVELTSNKLDSLLNIIHWDRNILDQIKTAIKKANCISIQNGEPTEVGFARSGMGKYSYAIFDVKLNDEKINTYNDGCEYIYYKENIVLMYGGGAIGPQCFPDKE